ncbi:MAG: DUF3040 domain-containing protein [Candidatus Nanopelagicales bacterium]|jgi:hypothetical protein
MALSDREQKLLEQMEQALYAEDPRFATSLKKPARIAIAPGERRHLLTGTLALVIAIGLVIGSVATKLVLLGILGFVFLLIGLFMLIRGLQAPVAAVTPKPRKGPGAGDFMRRMEQRWQQRREGDY